MIALDVPFLVFPEPLKIEDYASSDLPALSGERDFNCWLIVHSPFPRS
jgi:hypothetical protein